MLLVALAAAVATPSPAPTSARIEARATVRIVRGTAVRFDSVGTYALPRPTERTVRAADGSSTVIRLVEFQ